MRYEGIEVNAHYGWDDVETQVRELETHELLATYKMFAENPTLFQLVSNELTWRAEHQEKIASTTEIDEIQELGLSR